MHKPELFLGESKVCERKRTVVGPRLSWNGFGVLNRDLWFTCRSRDGQTLFAKQSDVFLHAPLRFVKTIFDGVTDTSKALQVGRIEAEEVGVFGGFDD
jgi:hypothetical protein